MSLTIKEKLKIQETNKKFLNEYKQNVIFVLKKHFRQCQSEYVSFEKYAIYIDLLEGCDCNLATINFIKNKIKG